MSSPCIKCVNLDLKSDERMTKVGFARCKKFPTYCYTSVHHEIECEHYKEAKPEIVEKRIEWRAKREACKKNR